MTFTKVGRRTAGRRPRTSAAAAFTAAAVMQAIEPRVMLAAQLIADLNTDTAGSTPRQFTEMGDLTLFTATDGINSGAQLWRTDGTPGGTALVKVVSSNPNITLMPAISDDVALFWASDPEHGTELWRTDGTAAGTSLLKDINPGTASAKTGAGTAGTPPDNPIVLDGVLYFRAGDATYGQELWRSDGTADGTWMVEDLFPGTTGSSIGYQTAMNGVMYFSALESGSANAGLFRSDGTAAGTYRVSTAAALPGG